MSWWSYVRSMAVQSPWDYIASFFTLSGHLEKCNIKLSLLFYHQQQQQQQNSRIKFPLHFTGDNRQRTWLTFMQYCWGRVGSGGAGPVSGVGVWDDSHIEGGVIHLYACDLMKKTWQVARRNKHAPFCLEYPMVSTLYLAPSKYCQLLFTA